MKLATLLLTALASGSALAQFMTSTDHAKLGAGEIVTLEKENTFNLIGKSVKVGQYMPSATLLTSELNSYDTSAKSDKVKIYSVLASVDTPVCVQQAIELSKYISAHQSELQGIEFYAVSADTPFAQQRFIKAHSLKNATYLSDAAEHEFGLKTGSQIKELGLLTRSIVVTDKDNKIIFVQRVPELTTIPDLEAAINIAKQHI